MILEIRRTQFGLGLTTERWPHARHVVVRVGRRSVRVIRERGEHPGWVGLVGTVIAGFLLAWPFWSFCTTSSEPLTK